MMWKNRPGPQIIPYIFFLGKPLSVYFSVWFPYIKIWLANPVFFFSSTPPLSFPFFYLRGGEVCFGHLFQVRLNQGYVCPTGLGNWIGRHRVRAPHGARNRTRSPLFLLLESKYMELFISEEKKYIKGSFISFFDLGSW